ncbi:MAG: hypothetical protein KH231_07550 [Dialister sp.]|uniref:hypothetical protein n=1 Tax=Dialister sp. TaxID=1955814 RepID=UPI001DD14ABE|nr:hypothetical protein [Dialister sp.]MBS6715309.1 hypothetical protein [Dialister sp.]
MQITKPLIVAMSAVWKQNGIIFENIEFDGSKVSFWITVPEHSEYINKHGEEMSGYFLAKRFQTAMKELFDSIQNNIAVLTMTEIRIGETWTKGKGDYLFNSTFKNLK